MLGSSISMSGGGGGTGDMLKSTYDTDDDGKVNSAVAADTATTATNQSGGTVNATSVTDSGLTSGRIPIAGTGGLLGDDSDLTFSGATLTATNISGDGSLITGIDTAETVTISTIGTDGLRAQQHNIMTFTSENLWTFNGNQYTVYIDSDGHVTVGKRALPSEAWSVVDTGKSVTTTDLHCGASLGIDPDGYIHVFYGFHDSAITGHYMVSHAAENISTWDDKTQMTGSNENAVTYVKCFTNGSYLFCTYRNGSSGNGETYLNKYAHATTSWSAIQAPFINTTAAVNNPYPSEIAVDSAGKFHIAWTWRELGTNGAWSNENICYAYSDDSGANWKKADGTSYTPPIEFAASEVADTVASGINGLLNDPRLAVDSSNYPHITYYKSDTNGFINYYHTWYNGTAWATNQITTFTCVHEDDIPWYGTLDPLPLARPSIVMNGTTAYVLFTFPIMSGNLYAAVADSPYTSWSFHRLGSNAWASMEINWDKQYWASNARLDIVASAPDRETGSIPIYSLSTTPSGWVYGRTFDQTFKEINKAIASTTAVMKYRGIQSNETGKMTEIQFITEKIVYYAPGVSSTPRTATVSSVSGTTLTLTAAVAASFWNDAMDGNCYLKIYNTTKDTVAWISDMPANNQLTVTVAGDISAWKNGDTITTAYDGDGGSLYTQLDLSPILPMGARFIYGYISFSDTGAYAGSKGANTMSLNAPIVYLNCYFIAQNVQYLTYSYASIDDNKYIYIRDRCTGSGTGTTQMRVTGYCR